MTWEEAVRSLIEDPSKRELVEACYFDEPLLGAAARYAASDEWREIARIAGSPDGIAVDIGAGNGIVSYALAKEGWRAIAVEPDPSNLVGAGAIRRLAQEAGVVIDVREGYGESLPLADGEAHLVVARQVLHHARDLPAFCREIARVLAPGGRLIAARDHVITGPEQLPAFLAGHPLHSLYGGENAFQIDQYRAALKQAGLEIEIELGSLDSPMNYAPHTHDTLRAEIAGRLGLLGPVVRTALAPDVILRGALKVLSTVDRRPGRLVSFVCRRLAPSSNR
jgi:SAM-dependent methyltransferase